MARLVIILGVAALFISLYELPSVGKKQNDFDELFKKYGALYGINPLVLKGIAFVESSFNPNAKNPASSATGLMQVTKAAAQDMGENHAAQTDPETAIRTGAKYLAWLRDTYFKGDILRSIRAYYAGAGTILKGDANQSALTGWQIEAYAYSNKYAQKVVSAANSMMLS